MDKKGLCVSMCGKIGTKHCAECKVTRYCSVKCQREDWVKHKKDCALFKTHPDRGDIAMITKIHPDTIYSIIAEECIKHKIDLEKQCGFILRIKNDFFDQETTPPPGPRYELMSISENRRKDVVDAVNKLFAGGRVCSSPGFEDDTDIPPIITIILYKNVRRCDYYSKKMLIDMIDRESSK